LDVTIGLPAGATRTAMRFLVLERGRNGNGDRDRKQIDLVDLCGAIRLVLPPGETAIGFQRARGALGTSGATMFVAAGVVTVDVQGGKGPPVVLGGAARLTTAEVAGERHQ